MQCGILYLKYEEYMEEDMAEDRHLWCLGEDRRLLAV